MKRSIAGVALVAVLVTGGLSGCGGNGTDPTPSQTASVKEQGASESPSGTATSGQPTPPIDVNPPERPAAMDNADEAGAVAAAEYFLQLTGYAAASGSTLELESLSGADCDACMRMIERPVAFHEAGGWSEMPEVSISDARSQRINETPLTYQVECNATRGEYNYFTEEKGVTHVGSETLAMGFVMTMHEDWEIDQILVSKPDESDVDPVDQ